MSSPKRGYLLEEEGLWSFLPGRSPDMSINNNAPFALEDFTSKGASLIDGAQLHRGWISRAQAEECKMQFIAQNQ
eukprot:5028503-Ditylum_brightwellii.AAC.1